MCLGESRLGSTLRRDDNMDFVLGFLSFRQTHGCPQVQLWLMRCAKGLYFGHLLSAYVHSEVSVLNLNSFSVGVL